MGPFWELVGPSQAPFGELFASSWEPLVPKTATKLARWCKRLSKRSPRETKRVPKTSQEGPKVIQKLFKNNIKKKSKT